MTVNKAFTFEEDKFYTSLEETNSHITENIQEVTSNILVCIDDRDKSKNTASYPGGEVGKVVTIYTVLKKKGISDNEIQNYLNEKYPTGVAYHGANGHTCNTSECGDMNLISKNYRNYGMNKEGIDFIGTLTEKYKNNGEEIADYEGNHNPAGIIFFEGLDSNGKPQTITSKGGKGKDNYFLFGKGYQENTINPKLAKELNSRFSLDMKQIEVTLNEEDTKHFENTIGRLAKGTKKFERKGDTTTYIGKVGGKKLGDTFNKKDEDGKTTTKNNLGISSDSFAAIDKLDKKYQIGAQSILRAKTKNNVDKTLGNT